MSSCRLLLYPVSPDKEEAGVESQHCRQLIQQVYSLYLEPEHLLLRYLTVIYPSEGHQVLGRLAVLLTAEDAVYEGLGLITGAEHAQGTGVRGQVV